MISATLTSVDSGDSISFEINPIQETRTRRVSRSATLDGGSVITDGGFSDSDRTLPIECVYPYQGMDDDLAAIAETGYSRLSLPNGLFLGVIESIDASADSVSFSFLVSEKII